MGCRKCRGWEDSECCLSQQDACACTCHTSCDCAFCYTIELKERTAMRGSSGCGRQNQHQHSHQTATSAKTAAMRLTTALRLESKITSPNDGSISADEHQQTTGERKS
ncbi:hypothetical protein IW140_006617, partial [Coemansia sp. RSA 1813]